MPSCVACLFNVCGNYRQVETDTLTLGPTHPSGLAANSRAFLSAIIKCALLYSKHTVTSSSAAVMNATDSRRKFHFHCLRWWWSVLIRTWSWGKDWLRWKLNKLCFFFHFVTRSTKFGWLARLKTTESRSYRFVSHFQKVTEKHIVYTDKDCFFFC